MMMFFKMGHKLYRPWIQTFILGEDDYSQEVECSVCGAKWRAYINDDCFDKPLDALLDKSQAGKWPDIIGDGHRVFFTIVSQRVLEIWEAEGIGTFPAFPVRIVPPFPKTFTTEPPMYYRLDYKQMEGAELDFEASGFIGMKYCESCKNYSWDRTQSDMLSDFKIIPRQLKDGTWNGANVFRPKFPYGNMFCTENVIDCACKHKLTNFRFVPLELGHGINFRGVDYLTKNWRVKLQKQIEEYRKNFRPIDPLTRQYVE